MVTTLADRMDGAHGSAQNGEMPDLSDDRHAVQDVIVRYAACLDDRDFESYRRCFTDDVELEGFRREPVHGLEAWMSFVAHALESYRATQHMLGVPLIEIDGDSARMRTDLQASHFPADPKGRTFTLWATYESSLVRTQARWRIRHHRLVPRAQKFEEGVR